MKIHPALLGVFLALTFTTTLVASQDADSCDTSADCPETDNTYCNASLKKCIAVGDCVELSDCNDLTNSPYTLTKCMGTIFCDKTCQMDCSTMGSGATKAPAKDAASASVSTTREGEDESVISRDTSAPCPDNTYYNASLKKCIAVGGCFEVADCNLGANQGYAIAPCFGSLECNDRVCAMNCSGGSDALQSCKTSKDCRSLGEYCTTEETCRPGGVCFADADCSLPDNQFMAIECVGTVGRFFCENYQCGKECGTFTDKPVAAVPSIPEFETTKEDGSPVSILVTQCKMDSDCMSSTTSTTRAAVLDSYCADGVCTKHGNCFTDGDCINPSNVLFEDKKCMGYLHCTEMGMCDRVCGDDCKNGSRMANCFVNPCDSQPLCEGAVSCAMTTCDGECNALYYTADGVEFSCGNVVMPWDDTNPISSPNGATTTESSNLDSSAVLFRGTSSYAALLVAVLAAAAFV